MKPKNNYKPGGQDVAQTPPHAIEPLLPYLNKNWWIWESAAGPEKILADALGKQGFITHATDLLYSDCYNYFTYNPPFHYDIEITNVPFSLKYEWLKRAFERGKRFAFLAPYETTFAKEFQKLFKEYNGMPVRGETEHDQYLGHRCIEILSPERRIAYKMPDMGWGKFVWDEKKQKEVWRDTSAQMPTVWITWGLHVDQYKRSHFEYLRTYYVPMRNVKYNSDNTEKV